MKLEPLVFEEDFHPTLWGGERWLVSAHPSAPSRVKGGTFAGRRLDELAEELGAELIGRCASGRFPLLIKEIDAHTRLSVQVHPNEATAAGTGGEPKTEMWHVLEAERDGAVYAGLKPGTTREDLERAVKDGHFEKIVLRHPAEPGLGVFIPGGLVHAIGDGVKLFEVQQSSNTTYRLYDWGRKGADGKPRPLHVAEALATADLGTVPVTVKGALACPFFHLTPRVLTTSEEVAANSETFRVLFAVEGAFKVDYASGELEIPSGGVVLVPAVIAFKLIPAASKVRLIEVSL